MASEDNNGLTQRKGGASSSDTAFSKDIGGATTTTKSTTTTPAAVAPVVAITKKSSTWKYVLIATLWISYVIAISRDSVYVRHIRELLLSSSSSLLPKYKSSLIYTTPQRTSLSAATDMCKHYVVDEHSIKIIQPNVSASDIMNRSHELYENNTFMAMLNGANVGHIIQLNNSAFFNNDSHKCALYALANGAAISLGADTQWLSASNNSVVDVRNQLGQSVETFRDVMTVSRIFHVMLDYQLWVWPGIEVGYQYHLEDSNVTMTTMSLSPRVLSVESFFTEAEALHIINTGLVALERSLVANGDNGSDFSSDRTSFTAFLNDTAFTRDFKARTSALARLPSPSFTERLQLVRYNVNQYFRRHEDYFDSKDFLPKPDALSDYNDWTSWASTKLTEEHQNDRLSQEEFVVGGKYYPDSQNLESWQHELLGMFLIKNSDFFINSAELEWKEWIEENLKEGAYDILSTLLSEKGYMLPSIIEAWEAKLQELTGIELHYDNTRHSKDDVSAVSRYFYWIRWLKPQIQECKEDLQLDVMPGGYLYPRYGLKFQTSLVKLFLKNVTKESDAIMMTEDWYDWIVDNQDSEDVLLDTLRAYPTLFSTIVDLWEKTGNVPSMLRQRQPSYIRHFEPNRFVTLFLYLNDVPNGGETVFPYSPERLVTGINRTGMSECSTGLAVPPIKLKASLFYAQTPDQLLDPKSLHGGCPPAEGVKYGANLFAWNADADEGSDALGF